MTKIAAIKEEKMKKVIIVGLVLMIIFNVSGCKNKNTDTNNLDSTNVSQNNNQDTQTDSKDQSGTESDSTDQTGKDNTVSQDVYGDNSSVEAQSDIDYTNATGTPVTETAKLADFLDYIEKFYYNFLFNPNSETGKMTESDMQLFAISYIYQYEYAELRFDSEKFILYVPDTHVSEVIKRFFDYNFTNHKYPENTDIAYEDGYYLMPAKDENLGAKPTITQALKLSDFDYKVVFKSSDSNAPKVHYEAILEERDGRYIMINCKKISD